jgi:hypothetical protein
MKARWEVPSVAGDVVERRELGDEPDEERQELGDEPDEERRELGEESPECQKTWSSSESSMTSGESSATSSESSARRGGTRAWREVLNVAGDVVEQRELGNELDEER